METQEIDLRALLLILRRHLWMIILIPLVAAASAYIYTVYFIPPTYQATATVWIKGEAGGGLDYSSVLTSQYLAKTYSEVARSLAVTEEAARRLNLPGVTDQMLLGQLRVEPVRDTEILKLTVTDGNPELAALKVNVITDAFKEEIERSQMVEHIRIVDRARVPAGPVGPRANMNRAIAFVLGFMTAIGIAFLLEYLDTSIRTPEDVERHLRGPVLGTIPFVAVPAEKSGKHKALGVLDPMLVAQLEPSSPAAEAFRVLRTNLQFLGLDRPLKSILVTSTSPNEGKSVTSGNLALALAQAGANVCLVDTDLRRPTQAKLFGLNRAEGLTQVLLGARPLEEVLQEPVSGLSVLPSGPIPPNPAEMLGSQRMQRLLKELEERFDFVILDSPPVLGLADAVTLAPRVDGVVMVLRSGGIEHPEAKQAHAALVGVRANILGMVLDGLKPSNRYYKYRYAYAYTGDGRRKESAQLP